MTNPAIQWQKNESKTMRVVSIDSLGLTKKFIKLSSGMEGKTAKIASWAIDEDNIRWYLKPGNRETESDMIVEILTGPVYCLLLNTDAPELGERAAYSELLYENESGIYWIASRQLDAYHPLTKFKRHLSTNEINSLRFQLRGVRESLRQLKQSSSSGCDVQQLLELEQQEQGFTKEIIAKHAALYGEPCSEELDYLFNSLMAYEDKFSDSSLDESEKIKLNQEILLIKDRLYNRENVEIRPFMEWWKIPYIFDVLLVCGIIGKNDLVQNIGIIGDPDGNCYAATIDHGFAAECTLTEIFSIWFGLVRQDDSSGKSTAADRWYNGAKLEIVERALQTDAKETFKISVRNIAQKAALKHDEIVKSLTANERLLLNCSNNSEKVQREIWRITEFISRQMVALAELNEIVNDESALQLFFNQIHDAPTAFLREKYKAFNTPRLELDLDDASRRSTPLSDLQVFFEAVRHVNEHDVFLQKKIACCLSDWHKLLGLVSEIAGLRKDTSKTAIPTAIESHIVSNPILSNEQSNFSFWHLQQPIVSQYLKLRSMLLTLTDDTLSELVQFSVKTKSHSRTTPYTSRI